MKRFTNNKTEYGLKEVKNRGLSLGSGAGEGKSSVFLTFILTAIVAVGVLVAYPLFVFSAFNSEINYQGKLMDSAGDVVSNGDYHMKFRLYTAQTGGTSIWEGNRSSSVGDRITLTSGLFSVMLGSSTALTSLNFDQTLWLEVEVGGTASTTWETLSPRKKLGAVPAAFEASKLDGVDSTSFLRSDADDTFDSGSTLTLAGRLDSNGAVSFADTTVLFDGASTDFGITGDLTFNTNQLTLLKSSGNFGIGTTSPYAKLSVVGEIVGAYFTATTTATSTFAGGLDVLAINQTGSATSTFAQGLNLSSGCFAVNGTCVGGASTFLGLTDTMSSFTAGSLLFTSGSAVTQDNTSLFFDDTNNRLGIGTTSPIATLSVFGTTALDSTLITFASSTASTLTIDYSTTATSTIADVQSYAWTFATSTTATPIFKIDTSGTTGASGVATSTFTGSFGINSGAFLYDSGSNKTSIERLDLGAINFEDDAGKISWIDLPVTSTSASGDVQAYSAQIDTNQILTMYSQSDGAGGITDVRVVIGTSTDAVLGSSNIPYGSLIVADGIICVDDGGAANCDDVQRFAGGLYATSTTVTAIDVAENYPTKDESIEAGDIVMIDLNNPVFVSKYDTASTTADIKPVLLGAISTSPGLLLGGFANNMFKDEIKVPVVLSGRIPVKVNTENGNISVGDRITPSSISGVGMKANTTDDTIGIALESYGVVDEIGKIIVFIDLDDRDNAGLFSAILSWFEEVGVKIVDGIVSAREFIADKITTDELCIGSTCVNEAQLQKLLGDTSSSLNSVTSEVTSNSTINTSETNVDTTPPVITLNGNNPAEISVGVKYSDLGAVITDDVNNNLGYKVRVDGGEEMDISKLNIDTSVDIEYIISFSATDQAGNNTTTNRIVIVSDGVSEEPENTGPETTLDIEESQPVDEVIENEEELAEEIEEVMAEDENQLQVSEIEEESFIEIEKEIPVEDGGDINDGNSQPESNTEEIVEEITVVESLQNTEEQTDA